MALTQEGNIFQISRQLLLKPMQVSINLSPLCAPCAGLCNNPSDPAEFFGGHSSERRSPAARFCWRHIEACAVRNLAASRALLQ